MEKPMEKKALLIFKGWSSTRSLYKDIEEIYRGWDIYYDDEVQRIDINSYQKTAILAWSMGTLDAIEFEYGNRVDEMILISPTLDFTSTTRPVILKRMIRRLGTDREGCLEDFTKLCFDDETEARNYWSQYKDEILEVDTEILIAGLNKLLNKKIEADERKISPLIILGTDDKVISGKNSQKVIDTYPGSTVHTVEGGHNLLYEKKDQVIRVIEEYRSKRCHT